MKQLLTFLLLFVTVSFFAQTYNITWKSKSNIAKTSKSTVFIPSIQSENSYIDSKNIPHFNVSEKTGEFQNFDVRNFSTIEISAKDLGDIHISNLPEKPEFTAKTRKGRNVLIKDIDITGLYRTGKRIYQITGFQVIRTGNVQPSMQRTPPAPVLNSVNGRFYKISIDTTGIYRIDRSFLSQNGIPLDFNPQKFKIFGNGGMMLPENPGAFRYNGLQESAIYAHGMEDGSMDEGDYFLFYAQGPNGINRDIAVSYTHLTLPTICSV